MKGIHAKGNGFTVIKRDGCVYQDDSGHKYEQRDILSESLKRLMLIVLMLTLVWVTACGKAEKTPDSSETTAPTMAPEATPTAPAENLDPLGKYDPPITLSTVKIFNSVIKFAPGETPEKNIWIDGYLKDLGIEMKIN